MRWTEQRVLGAVVLALGCGRSDVYRPCHPVSPSCPEAPSSSMLSQCPAPGAVHGRVCATDGVTWVNGASVSLSATDCNGAAVTRTVASGADGSFTLDGVPPGSWTVSASVGSFTHQLPVKVESGKTAEVSDGELCVKQGEVRIAVVTGTGDRIENLLAQLQLQYTLIRGDGAYWAMTGAPFFEDLAQLQKFDLVFVDCAAGRSGPSSGIDFGPKAQQIEDNLRAYVLQGGSLYSSDWALLFAHYAAPDAVSWATRSGQPVASPLDTSELLGFAPQTLEAQVSDPGLAQFLGKSTLPVAFPNQPGAASKNWGLIDSLAQGQVLVRADGVTSCADLNCTMTGATRDQVPLAVWVKTRPPDAPGGNVVYTSFHNIAQSGGDVGQLLKYLVLHL